MKINAKKDKFMPTIILDITLEIFFLIPTILVFFLALDIKIELLGIIISLFILSVPNVFLIGNIVTGIKYYKGISIVIEEDTLYLNLLLPSKNISKKIKYITHINLSLYQVINLNVEHIFLKNIKLI